MRIRAYCAHHSTHDHWELRCLSRCPEHVVSLMRDSKCLSLQASLILIYRPTSGTDRLAEITAFTRHITEWKNKRALRMTLKNYTATSITVMQEIDCQVIYSQFGLAIHQNNHQARRRFVEWAQNQIAVYPDFHKRILFSDEAYFWLNGYVNKQNCRIWSEANPQVYVETPLHPEKLTVWCALWAGGIIDPYFFKNDEGHNVTVNGDRYRVLITNFFILELNNRDVQELWFQQDVPHSSYHNRFIERHVW
ncbi:DUF4817 domain-containing protein [Trichonephila clavipes]|nr:DUF4817 domain-containing protein [Trichonephila clavipes]